VYGVSELYAPSSLGLRISQISRRYDICLTGGVLRFTCRALVILAAALICAAKLRGNGPVTPVVATQELNRCLSVVRAAARRGAVEDRSPARQEANVRLVA
jgi:hypothetical protein